MGAVLESLFRAGFYLEATYPIRSDETKGEGASRGHSGRNLIEYDIIHVCRKRVDEPNEISWARLRDRSSRTCGSFKTFWNITRKPVSQEADLQVIRRGKALEYYSKHYGRVYVEKGRDFTVKEALPASTSFSMISGIQLPKAPPVDAEPYTRQFLRLFADTKSLARDQMQKYLRGTGVSPNEFPERGWCNEEKKIFHVTPPLEQAQKWKGVYAKGWGEISISPCSSSVHVMRTVASA